MNQRTYTPTQSTDEAIYERHKNDTSPEMKAFIKWYESGKKPPKSSKINWNVRLRDRFRELRKNGKSFEEIHQLVKQNMSLSSVKQQIRTNTVSNTTARSAYYQAKG